MVSVRQVTQRNTGRRTAGIDGEVAMTAEARAEVAVRVHQSITSWNPRAVRRVYIPKASNRAKLRPLGIPVLMDRCHQARVRNALEPEWEARFEPRSYGFRPGRSCQDAIGAIYNACKGPTAKRVWALDADLAAAFDRIDHRHLLGALGVVPRQGPDPRLAEGGGVRGGQGFAPTEEGTPSGRRDQPVLLNVALHGLEEAAGVRYQVSGVHAGRPCAGSPVAVRYADDMVVLCHSQQQAEQVKARLAEWLAPRGLAFNEDKTRIVHLDRRLRLPRVQRPPLPNRKLLIKPSKAAVRRLRERLAAEMRTLRGGNAMAVIARINPVIRGWAAYYRRRGVIQGFRLPGPLPVAARLQVGHMAPPEQAEALGHPPVLRQVQQVQERPGGYSATATAAPTWSGSPGPTSCGTHRSRARHPPMTPPWPATGPNGGRRSGPRWTRTTCTCCPGRTGSARYAETPCCPPGSRPSLPANGNDGGCTSPEGDSRQLPRPPRAARNAAR